MKYLCVVILWCSSVALAQSTSHGEVTIYRDAMGVPHIVGETSAAVMYGLGYALAQDRLVQLELSRRGALGTRAEILGPSSIGTGTTARDRKLGSAELMRMYRTIPPEHQAMMQSYVDCINRYIAAIARDPGHETPYEFTQWGIVPQSWTLLDYLAIIAAMPIGRAGYELQNLAFFDAMVAQYGPDVGRRIFEDVVPLNDPDSPTTIPEGEDLAPRQPAVTLLDMREINIVETLRKTIDTLQPQFPGKNMEEWRLPVFWKYFDPARESPDHPVLPGDPPTARAWAVLGLGPARVVHNGGEEWVGLMELNPDRPVLYSVVEAGGQSMFIDPSGKGSPHLTDQVTMHAENEFKRIDLSPDLFERAPTVTTHLTF